MAKTNFDPDSAFRSIVGASAGSAKEMDDSGGRVAGATSDIGSYVFTPQKGEAKSRRVNFVIRPSVHDRAKKKCNRLGISLNDCVNQFLEKWADE